MSNVTLPSLNNKSAWQLLSAHDEICRLCHVGMHVQHGRSHKNKKSFVALTVFMSQTQHNSLKAHAQNHDAMHTNSTCN